MGRERLKADLILLLVALIWGSAFAAQRAAAEHLDAFLFNGLRFLVAGGVLGVVGMVAGRREKQSVPAAVSSSRRWQHPTYILLAGTILFAAGALQQIGISQTTAGNAGFLTSLYVVLVPLWLFLFWRRKVAWTVWAGAGLAVLGSLFLGAGGEQDIGWKLGLGVGDALVLLGAVFWAWHVIVIGLAVRQVEVLTLSIWQNLLAGALNLGLALGLGCGEAVGAEGCLQQGLAPAWWAVAYTGIFSLGLGYTLQAYGQKTAPPADAAILLSMEAVFAALFGALFLGESLRMPQLVGGGLILAAILLTQLRAERPV